MFIYIGLCFLNLFIRHTFLQMDCYLYLYIVPSLRIVSCSFGETDYKQNFSIGVLEKGDIRSLCIFSPDEKL